MEQLVKQLVEKVGIDEKQAKEAIQVVMTFLGDKLPNEVRGVLNGVVNSLDDAADQAGDAIKGAADKAGDKVDDLKGQAESGLGGIISGVKGLFGGDEKK